MAGFENRQGPLSQRRFGVRSFLKDLSSLGMKYDDMVIRNSQAIGVQEDQFGYGMMNPLGLDGDDMWYPFAALSLGDTTFRKKISFFDKSYLMKRRELRRFALNDEIEEILDIVCDEAIVYDNKNFFAKPEYLSIGDDLKLKEEIVEDVSRLYNQIYLAFNFNLDNSAWTFFRKFLIDGYLAFEIIYDDKQENIIGFKELDPITLMPGIDKKTNKKIWIQHKDNAMKERVLFDSQIIYISYALNSVDSRDSYLERLVRAFNIMRIMEQTRVTWAVMNASYRMKFVIPVGGKSKTRAQQSLAQLMQNYREQVDFDLESGVLEVNGKPMMAFNKEYWLPSKDGEQPEIDTLGNDGPDLSDTEALKYFGDKLKLASKIPFSRFDKDSPATYEMSADGLIREEIKYAKFINRLRSIFQEILIKPLYLQMLLKYPNLKDDINFKAAISLQFNKENMFEELKEFDIYDKRVQHISNLRDSLVEQDEDLNDVPFFDLKFLIHKYLKMDPEDLRENEEYKKKNKSNSQDSEENADDDADF